MFTKKKAIWAALLSAAAVGVFAKSDDPAARQCIGQVGSGSSFTYVYKDVGFDGKTCTKSVHISIPVPGSANQRFYAKDLSRDNRNWTPGFQPGASVMYFN